MSSLPLPSSTTLSAFKVALELYPSIAEKVYRSKLKDSKKINEALERDRWRFEELPLSVAEVKKGKPNKTEAYMSKKTVERLVQWKITHGHSRPFLPAMVRKNDASAVEQQTSIAFEKLQSSSSAPPKPTLIAALDMVCKLTGIGPATGTLILNIFDPEHIPFFQDEMFLWFFPDLKGAKLKYTQKEYLQLYDAVAPVLESLGVQAVELEKVAYVLWHKDLLEDDDSSKLEKVLSGASNVVGEEAKAKPMKMLETAKSGKSVKRQAEAANDVDLPSSKRQSRRKRS
ncbi:uncharacterized protein A1O9_07793 [Exophiala aquamarina CBS 119918]|uniref:ADA HAT complex component 1 n=1 Tax=Exophiala aquamarina CBS 119918 TaxID=1182545 RepID=A0A072P901_9EURO|nr:uncharacterized protein A1O9_07793 [Exophiala aquamarina CBS 119918]KEF56212.1 hypothetical protein A1O9_07793 [Exophiala aquamarina CBS 119918]